MRSFSLTDRWMGRRQPRSRSLVAKQAPMPLALWAFVPLNLIAMFMAFSLLDPNRPPEVAAMTVVMLGTLNSVLGAMIALRLRGYEMPNRRLHVRLVVELPAELNGERCELTNVSLGGAGVLLDKNVASALVGEQMLSFTLNRERFAFRTEVARLERQGPQTEVALRYLARQEDVVARLAIALLSEADPTTEHVSPTEYTRHTRTAA